MDNKVQILQNYYSQNDGSQNNVEGGLNVAEFFDVLRRNVFLILGCAFGFASLASLKIITSPPTYVAGFELLSEPVNIETKVTATDENSRKTREEITDVNLDEVQLKILQSPRLLLRAIEEVQGSHPDFNYSELVQGLTINIVSSSDKEQNILQVTFANSDKQKVEDVANALTKIYQAYSIEKRQSGVKRGIAFLDRQIPQISAQSRQIQQQIAELRTTYNFNNPDASLEQITGRINELERRQEENDLKRQELQFALDNLDRELANELSVAETSYDTSRYKTLLEKLKEIDLEISQKSTVFSERTEVLQALKREKQQLMSLIGEAKKEIRDKIVKQITVLDNRQQNLTVEIDKLKTKLRQWSQISGEFKSLQNQLNRANRKLNEFNSQKDALQIDAAQQESPWQLLTPAREAVTDDIGTVNYLLLGSTLGLLSGVSIAFLRDKQQNIIYNSAKVEQITDLPILAAIPYSPKPKKLSFLQPVAPRKERSSITTLAPIDRQKQNSAFAFSTPSVEAFRSFAANLGLLDFNYDSTISKLDRELKAIAVTSAIPQEGKSTVALNLAKATASMGKRVLIVDSDLRSKKDLSSNLGLESDLGLRNILKQNSADVPLNYVQKLPTEENLFILTSGADSEIESSIEEDPGRLLASSKMYSLMKKFEQAFDLVIYDLCSIIGFADVSLIAKNTDGIVMVTGLGKIQSVAFTEALNQLKLCNAPVLGVALNKLVNKN